MARSTPSKSLSTVSLSVSLGREERVSKYARKKDTELLSVTGKPAPFCMTADTVPIILVAGADVATKQGILLRGPSRYDRGCSLW